MHPISEGGESDLTKIDLNALFGHDLSLRRHIATLEAQEFGDKVSLVGLLSTPELLTSCQIPAGHVSKILHIIRTRLVSFDEGNAQPKLKPQKCKENDKNLPEWAKEQKALVDKLRTSYHKSILQQFAHQINIVGTKQWSPMSKRKVEFYLKLREGYGCFL